MAKSKSAYKGNRLSRAWKEFIGLYDDLIATSYVKDASGKCMFAPHEDGKVMVDFAGMYDEERVNFFYIVEGLPNQLPINFKDQIRSECKGDVKVTFLNKIRRHRIEWTSPQMKARLNILKQIKHDRDSIDIDEFNMHDNILMLGQQEMLQRSLRYLAISSIKHRRALFQMSMLVIISGVRGSDFDDSVANITSYTKDIGMRMERVLYDVPDILRHYSPFNSIYVKDSEKTMPVQVLTDEIIARFNTYNQGLTGRRGIYWGTDIFSRFPVFKLVKATTEAAENILITAETGGGKSMCVKVLLLQLLALGFNGTIMDVEGMEYLPIAYYIASDRDNRAKVKVINMGEGEGKYFDPVEIPQPTGIEDIDKEAKKLAVSYTMAILKVLLGSVYNTDIWVDIVINDVVSEMYKDAGVTEDPKTWSNSTGLSLKSVYDTLLRDSMAHFRSGSRTYSEAVVKCRAILGKYFEDGGTRASLFSSRVVVDDIVDSTLLICSFGMAGKSETAVDSVQMALMQLSAAQISHQRSIFSKAQNKYNFKIWEEIQRWGEFPDSDKTLGVAITGGRKLGDVNFAITNNVAKMLKNDVFGILSNKTSFMLGAIGDADVRTELCRRLTIPHMTQELHRIAREKSQEDEFESDTTRGTSSKTNSPFTHAFLVGLDGNKYALTKMVISSEIAKTSLFRTGIDLKKKAATKKGADEASLYVAASVGEDGRAEMKKQEFDIDVNDLVEADTSADGIGEEVIDDFASEVKPEEKKSSARTSSLPKLPDGYRYVKKKMPDGGKQLGIQVLATKEFIPYDIYHNEEKG